VEGVEFSSLYGYKYLKLPGYPLTMFLTQITRAGKSETGTNHPTPEYVFTGKAYSS